MKLKIKTIKPRNPFVVASMRRTAGAHGPNGSARRQQGQRALRLELHRLRHSP